MPFTDVKLNGIPLWVPSLPQNLLEGAKAPPAQPPPPATPPPSGPIARGLVPGALSRFTGKSALTAERSAIQAAVQPTPPPAADPKLAIDFAAKRLTFSLGGPSRPAAPPPPPPAAPTPPPLPSPFGTTKEEAILHGMKLGLKMNGWR
jgi:hypothetical protein